MTSNNGNLDHLDHQDHHLDAYLDGTLDAAARRTFERHLASRPDLRGRITEQQLIDDSIRRAFRPPSAERLTRLVAETIAAAGTEPAEAPARPRWSPTAWRGPIGIAAAVALLLGGAWMIWSVVAPAPPGPYAQQPFRSMATVYDDVVRAGLTPAIVCRDDAEFTQWFRRPFGQGLRLAETPGTTALGLGYANTISPWTIYVILTVDDAPVVVFVDKAIHDRDAGGDPPPGLRRFRRTVGDLVLYEVTPWDAARVLDGFSDPAADEEDG